MVCVFMKTFFFISIYAVTPTVGIAINITKHGHFSIEIEKLIMIL